MYSSSQNKSHKPCQWDNYHTMQSFDKHNIYKDHCYTSIHVNYNIMTLRKALKEASIKLYLFRISYFIFSISTSPKNALLQGSQIKRNQKKYMYTDPKLHSHIKHYNINPRPPLPQHTQGRMQLAKCTCTCMFIKMQCARCVLEGEEEGGGGEKWEK